MAFLKCRRGLLRLGFILLLIVSSGFLSACTGEPENRSGAGEESNVAPLANTEEGTQGNGWNKMTWDAGTWG